jgi:putative transposase
VFPKTEVQLCIVHMVRNSLKFVPYKDRKAVATDLKSIYLSPTEEAAEVALDAFAEKWDGKYPMICRSWRTRWPEVIPFLKFPEVIRKAVYTTNAIESLNYTIRKVTRNRQSFPTAEAAMKLVFMALRNISKK